VGVDIDHTPWRKVRQPANFCQELPGSRRQMPMPPEYNRYCHKKSIETILFSDVWGPALELSLLGGVVWTATWQKCLAAKPRLRLLQQGTRILRLRSSRLEDFSFNSKLSLYSCALCNMDATTRGGREKDTLGEIEWPTTCYVCKHEAHGPTYE
jgi:hypothetical protein